MDDEMKTVDFFFDFMSPFAYLAHQRLPQLVDKFGYGISYKPIDLKAAKLAAGNTGPANVQIPVKIRYLLVDLTRWAERYGVPFKMPKVPSFDSARANKGTFFAIERGRARDYVTHVWRESYGSGGSIGSEDLLKDVARQMDWSPQEFLDFTQSDAAERLYEQTNKEAHSRGVFGVPIMMVGENMWWGNDRLDFLEEYLIAQCSR